MAGLGLVAWAAWSFLRPRGAAGQSGEVIGGGGGKVATDSPSPTSSSTRTSSTSSRVGSSTPIRCGADSAQVFSPTKGWGCGGGTPGALELYDMRSEPRVIIGEARFE